MTAALTYSTGDTPTVEEFADVLRRSTLAEHRPMHDAECLTQMVEHTSLWATCRLEGKLVGVARSLTDFVYSCYLADLAVDQEFARRGIGQRLIEETRARLGPHAKVILLAAPKAVDYYPRIGFTAHPSAWTLDAHPGPTSH
jgi:GNAT superfamily N-acetyltransferase